MSSPLYGGLLLWATGHQPSLGGCSIAQDLLTLEASGLFHKWFSSAGLFCT